MLLADTVNGTNRFPLRLCLKKPSAADVANEFAEARDWIKALHHVEKYGCRIVWRSVNHRVVGQNMLPEEIWIDTFDKAVALIGKQTEAEKFARVQSDTRIRQPLLLLWLERYPLKALSLAEDWPRILDIVCWMQTHPLPGVFLRQVDIPGVHTKFIERHRATLAELFDLALPPEAITKETAGVRNFCRRYGFLEKPQRVRFRVLDPALSIFADSEDQDIDITHSLFARLSLPLRMVFLVENEISLLAFPRVQKSIAIFGGGYGFDMLAKATWLQGCRAFYWGDIDTHGFAILDQFRVYLPHAQSLLMDRETLLHHRPHWVTEPRPELRDLPRLNSEEMALYDDIRYNRLGKQVRLEQEVIGVSFLQTAIEAVLEQPPVN